MIMIARSRGNSNSLMHKKIHDQQFHTVLVVIIILIGIAAGWARLATFDFSLPYVDHPDEPTLYLKAQEWRGLFDLQDHAESYPPAVISVNYVAQNVLEQLGHEGLSPTTEVMRFLSVITDLIALGLVMATAYLVGGLFAATATGLAWSTSSILLEHGVYALADPWVYMMVALTVFLAVVSAQDERRKSWVVWSIVAGLLAMLFKYPAVAVLSVPGVVLLIHLWHNPRLGMRYLAIIFMIGIAAAVFLLIVYRADRFVTRDSTVSNRARDNGLKSLIDGDRVWNNIYYAIWPLNPDIFAVVSVIGVLAYLIARWRGLSRIKPIGVMLVIVALITIPWLDAVVIKVSPDKRLRDVLPATHVAYVLIGAAMAQITLLVPEGRRRQIVQIGLLLLIVFGYRSELRASRELIDNRQRPDMRVDVRAWTDSVLEPGTVIVYAENAKTFNPYWGNSEATKWFDWLQTKNILEHSVISWREEYGTSYALLTISERDSLAETSGGKAFLDQLLLLNEFGEAENVRGPELAFYRMWRMDVDQTVHFGDTILLRGYDFSVETVAPDDQVELRFYWQALVPPQSNFSLFIHLTPLPDSTILTQADGAPGVSSRPTLLWTSPSETIISQPFTLTIPSDLAPGTYQIRIGLYDYETFIRLPVSELDSDSYPLMMLTVVTSGAELE